MNICTVLVNCHAPYIVHSFDLQSVPLATEPGISLIILNPGILDYTWFSDEAWFHLSVYINSQNSPIWASENPNAIHEEPPHSEKIGVWCGMSRRRIIGPIFFDATITPAAYIEIFNTFVNQLDDEELSVGYFQQDGATSHNSHASMTEIQSFFGDRDISKGFWPPRSPDLTPPDLPKQTTNYRRLESKHHRRNSGSDSGRTGKDFPKYGAPSSILSGRKWWPLPAHVMISSHFLHNEVSSLQISLQYPH